MNNNTYTFLQMLFIYKKSADELTQNTLYWQQMFNCWIKYSNTYIITLKNIKQFLNRFILNHIKINMQA